MIFMSTPFLIGNVCLKSSLTLEEVADIISTRLFGGLKFGGKDEDIHEEVPAVFLEFPILGLFVVLDGYPGLDEENGYCLYVKPGIEMPMNTNNVIMDEYLYYLCKNVLDEDEHIFVVENG